MKRIFKFFEGFFAIVGLVGTAVLVCSYFAEENLDRKMEEEDIDFDSFIDPDIENDEFVGGNHPISYEKKEEETEDDEIPNDDGK